MILYAYSCSFAFIGGKTFISLFLTLATSFLLLNAFDITSNIMSLTGIALAIGVIVDNGIIMAENAYNHLAERFVQLNASADDDANTDPNRSSAISPQGDRP